MKDLNETFRKLHEDFKRTIADLSKDVTAEVGTLKRKLQDQQVQQTLEPFVRFAEAIATLEPDHVITSVNGINLRAIDFQLLSRLLKDNSSTDL